MLESYSISNSSESTIELTGLHSNIFLRLYHAKISLKRPSVKMPVNVRRQKKSYLVAFNSLLFAKIPSRRLFRK